MRQIRGEGFFQGFVGFEEGVADAQGVAAGADGFYVAADVFEVAGADGGGIEFQFLGFLFEVLEEAEFFEGEVEFVIGHDLHDEDFVAFVAEVVEGLHEGVGVVEEVGDEDDHLAAVEAFGDFVEDGADGGVELGGDFFEGAGDGEEVGGGGAGGDEVAEFLVEGDEADGVLLVENEVAEAHGDELCVAEFGEGIVFAFVAHGAGGVDDDVGAEVGGDFVLFDVVAIRLSEDAPIDALCIIARNVLPMLGKVESEADVR